MSYWYSVIYQNIKLILFSLIYEIDHRHQLMPAIEHHHQTQNLQLQEEHLHLKIEHHHHRRPGSHQDTEGQGQGHLVIQIPYQVKLQKKALKMHLNIVCFIIISIQNLLKAGEGDVLILKFNPSFCLSVLLIQINSPKFYLKYKKDMGSYWDLVQIT